MLSTPSRTSRSDGLDWHLEVRFRHLGDHLHDLGPRAIGEALIAEALASGDPEAALRRLEPYGRLTPGMILAAGADRPLRPRLKVVR